MKKYNKTQSLKRPLRKKQSKTIRLKKPRKFQNHFGGTNKTDILKNFSKNYSSIFYPMKGNINNEEREKIFDIILSQNLNIVNDNLQVMTGIKTLEPTETSIKNTIRTLPMIMLYSLLGKIFINQS